MNRYHVAHEFEWDAAQEIGEYAVTGGVRTCTEDEVSGVLSDHFGGSVRSLVLLVIDAEALGDDLHPAWLPVGSVSEVRPLTKPSLFKALRHDLPEVGWEAGRDLGVNAFAAVLVIALFAAGVLLGDLLAGAAGAVVGGLLGLGAAVVVALRIAARRALKRSGASRQ